MPVILDASYGEGGGQVLRTALGLAVALRRPVELRAIRARRPEPGLRPQHLAVVRAVAAIGAADVEGDHIGSTTVRLAPRTPRAGRYRFDIGTAGSVALLLQAVLLPLLKSGGASTVEVRGGTHVPWSPPVHYLSDVFLPALRTIGANVEIRLTRWGWHPEGGGEIRTTIAPTPVLSALRATELADTELVGLSAVSRLPRSIAERQRRRVAQPPRAIEVVLRRRDRRQAQDHGCRIAARVANNGGAVDFLAVELDQAERGGGGVAGEEVDGELHREDARLLRLGIERLSPVRFADRLQAPVEILADPRDKYFPLEHTLALARASPLVRVTVTTASATGAPLLSRTVPRRESSAAAKAGTNSATTTVARPGRDRMLVSLVSLYV